MDVYKLQTIREAVGRDPYVGRGILVGTTPDGRAVIAYFIMGRSKNSRNRVFELREDGLYTKPFDAAKCADPSLIIYRAAGDYENNTVVTNGDQTDTILAALAEGGTFESALETRVFEPDAPNYTPRISAMVSYTDDSFTYKMSILKSLDAEGSDCARYVFSYPAKPGVGHFIHTYVGDGNPLPSFQGEPERIAIPNDTEAFVKELWDALDADNKISLYVSVVDQGDQTVYLLNKNGGDEK